MNFYDALEEMERGSICYKRNDPGLHFKLKDDGSNIIVMKREDWNTWGDCCLSYQDYQDDDWMIYDSKGSSYIGQIVECSVNKQLALVLGYKEDENKYYLLFEDGELREYTCSKYLTKIPFSKDTMYRAMLRILKNRNEHRESFEGEVINEVNEENVDGCPDVINEVVEPEVIEESEE